MYLFYLFILFHICYCEHICRISLRDLQVISNANLICGNFRLVSDLADRDLIRITDGIEIFVNTTENETEKIMLSNEECQETMMLENIPGHLNIHMCGKYLPKENNDDVKYIGFVNPTIQAEYISMDRFTQTECLLYSHTEFQLEKRMINDWKVQLCKNCKRACTSILKGDGSVFISNINRRRQITITPNSLKFIAKDFLFIHPWNTVCFRLETKIQSRDIRGIDFKYINGGYLAIRNQNDEIVMATISPWGGICQSFKNPVDVNNHYHICTQFDEQIYLPMKEIIIKGKLFVRLYTDVHLTRNIDWIHITAPIEQSTRSSVLFKETVFVGNETCYLSCNAAIDESGYVKCNNTWYNFSRNEMYKSFNKISSNTTLNVYDNTNKPQVVVEQNMHVKSQNSGVNKTKLCYMIIILCLTFSSHLGKK